MLGVVGNPIYRSPVDQALRSLWITRAYLKKKRILACAIENSQWCTERMVQWLAVLVAEDPFTRSHLAKLSWWGQKVKKVSIVHYFSSKCTSTIRTLYFEVTTSTNTTTPGACLCGTPSSKYNNIHSITSIFAILFIHAIQQREQMILKSRR